jgi:DTW domain-containing protein YfiP
VVFLQHPREARKAIGTARMAHLCLEGSSLCEGMAFDAHPTVRAALDAGGALLLYPGDGGLAPEALPAPPCTLIVVDGTWKQVRKLLAASPRIAALPRLGLLPGGPGGYSIRRTPAPEYLATIEAVALALGALEKDGTRYARMLDAFRWMVERQVRCAAGERSS